MHDRRNDSRLFCADLVEVRWMEEGREHRRIANLEDIAHNGACLLMEHGLPLGQQVVLHCGQQDFRGTVRHCTPAETGSLLGVEFLPDTQWSADGYSPDHLLDPADLYPGRVSENRRR